MIFRLSLSGTCKNVAELVKFVSGSVFEDTSLTKRKHPCAKILLTCTVVSGIQEFMF